MSQDHKNSHNPSGASQRNSLRIWQEREEEHRETLRRLQSEIDSRTQDLDALSSQLAVREGLISEIASYEGLLLELKNRYGDFKAKLTSIKDEITANTRLANETRDQARVEERRMREAGDEVDHLRKTADYLTSRLSELRSEEGRLNTQIASFRAQESQHLDEMRKWESELAARNIECTRLNVRLNELEEAGRLAAQNLKQISADEGSRKREIEELNRELEDKRKKSALQEARLLDVESRHSQLHLQIQEAEKRIEESRRDYGRIQMEIGSRTSELSQVLQNKDKLLRELSELATRKDVLTESNKSLSQEQQLLTEKIAVTVAETKVAKHSLDQLLGRIEQEKRLEQKISENITTLESQVSWCEEKSARLREQIVEQEMRLRLLEEENSRNEQLLIDRKRLMDERDKQIEELRLEINSLTDAKIGAEALIEDLQDKRQKLTLESALVSQRLQENSNKAQWIESELKSRQSMLQQLELDKIRRISEIETLDRRISELRTQETQVISSRTAEEALVSSLKEQVIATERNLHDVSRQVESEKSRLAAEREKVQTAMETTERVKQRVEDVALQLENITARRDETHVELLELRKQALEKSEDLTELESLRQDKLTRIEELRSEVAGLKREKIRLETQLRQTTASAQNANARNAVFQLRDVLKTRDLDLDAESDSSEDFTGKKTG